MQYRIKALKNGCYGAELSIVLQGVLLYSRVVIKIFTSEWRRDQEGAGTSEGFLDFITHESYGVSEESQ